MKREMMGEDDYDQNKRSRNLHSSKYDDALAENRNQLQILIPSIISICWRSDWKGLLIYQGNSLEV